MGRHTEQQIMERVQTMIARGVIRDVDDSTKKQIVGLELENGYRPSKVEHWHPYGFSTHPRSKAEVIALSLGGDRDHMVVIATSDRRYRMKVADGEVALHDDQGQVVHLKRDGLHIESSKPVTVKSGQAVTLEAPTITLKGDIAHTGNMTTSGVHTDSVGGHG